MLLVGRVAPMPARARNAKNCTVGYVVAILVKYAAWKLNWRGTQTDNGLSPNSPWSVETSSPLNTEQIHIGYRPRIYKHVLRLLWRELDSYPEALLHLITKFRYTDVVECSWLVAFNRT